MSLCSKSSSNDVLPQCVSELANALEPGTNAYTLCAGLPRDEVSYSLPGNKINNVMGVLSGLGTIAFTFGDAMLPEIQVGHSSSAMYCVTIWPVSLQQLGWCIRRGGVIILVVTSLNIHQHIARKKQSELCSAVD